MPYKYEIVSRNATQEKTIDYCNNFEDAKAQMLRLMGNPNLCGTLAIHRRKVYTVICYSRLGVRRHKDGCLKELIKYYSNLLSWWQYATPKTIDQLVDALNHCVSIQQGGCYHRDYYEKGEEK